MSVDVELLREAVGERASTIDAALADELVGGTPGYLHAAATHLVNAGGKRLRPVVLLLFAEAHDPDGDEAGRLPAALAVELVHTLSLIHDDIVDDGGLRRGVPSVHVAWDRSTGIVAGDLLYAMAFTLVQSVDAPAATRLACSRTLADGCRLLSEGQAGDMALAGRTAVTETAYLRTVEAKTGALFSAAAEIGTLLGGGDEPDRLAARAFGGALGTAFQLRDDVLDVTGSPAVIGKPVGTDLASGKPTLVSIHARRNGVDVSAGRVEQDGLEAVRAELEAVGSLDYAQRMAGCYVNRALSSLDGLPHGPARALLTDLTAYAVERER